MNEVETWIEQHHLRGLADAAIKLDEGFVGSAGDIIQSIATNTLHNCPAAEEFELQTVVGVVESIVRRAADATNRRTEP